MGGTGIAGARPPTARGGRNGGAIGILGRSSGLAEGGAGGGTTAAATAAGAVTTGAGGAAGAASAGAGGATTTGTTGGGGGGGALAITGASATLGAASGGASGRARSTTGLGECSISAVMVIGALEGARITATAACSCSLSWMVDSCSESSPESLPGVDSTASKPKWRRIEFAKSSSSELECVFLSSTPSTGSRSIILPGLTSSSLASSLIRILLIDA